MPAVPILFCSHVVEMGGAEVVLVDLLAALDRQRFAPHVACPGPGPLVDRCAALGVPVHDVPLASGGAIAKARSVPGGAWALRALARAHGCRLLVATSMIAGYAAVLARQPQLPCVWHLHVVTRSRIARCALRRASAVIAPSRAGLMAVDPRLAASPRGAVIRNGVDDRFFAAVDDGLRARLGLAAGTPLVGIVGRLDPQKGHEVLLAACEQLGPSVRPHLVVAGGELFPKNQARIAGFGERLRQQVAARAWADRVHWLGPVDDTAPLFAALDVVAVPSVALESAPRAIAEAQAAGRAVVASAIGGTPEMVVHGESGLLVPPGDPQALAAALAMVLGDEALRRRLGAGGRAAAEANYRMAGFARRCEEVFRRVLGMPG